MDDFNNAIELFKMGSRISQRNYGLPIVVTYSGGKDSDVLLEVAKASGEIMLMNDNDESRKIIEHCRLKGKAVCNPIIAFTEKEVWEILKDLKVETNPLYRMGYDRVGCVGCPVAGKCTRKQEFADFPKYKDMYIRAFDRMLEVRKQRGKDTQWKKGEEVFLWWMEDDNIEGQLSFDYENESISERLIDNY